MSSHDDFWDLGRSSDAKNFEYLISQQLNTKEE